MAQASRGGDRRKINISTPLDKRGQGQERRKCPECGALLKTATKRVATGSVTTTQCPACGYSKSSRQTDADLLMAKMTWALQVERKAGQFNVELPLELAEALSIKAGDNLVLSPLTLPIGSQPMRWALTLKRGGKRR